jgi:hypothetical protein
MAKTLKKTKRVFKQSTEFIHDLYKLDVGKAIKYIGWVEGGEHQSPFDDSGRFNNTDWTHIEHCHFFHTIDQRGQNQDKSTPTAGHFHLVKETKPATDEEPAQYEVSGPMQFVLVKKGGSKVKQIKAVPHDTHSHDINYIKSDVIKPRSISAEAAQAASMFIAKTTLPTPEPVSGISE